MLLTLGFVQYACSGVIAKQYKEIRESVRQIVVETLFDPTALKEYFAGRKKSVREMLLLGTCDAKYLYQVQVCTCKVGNSYCSKLMYNHVSYI